MSIECLDERRQVPGDPWSRNLSSQNKVAELPSQWHGPVEREKD